MAEQSSSDPDMIVFNKTLVFSLIIAIGISIVLFYFWNDGDKIVFIKPLTIEMTDADFPHNQIEFSNSDFPDGISECLATHLEEIYDDSMFTIREDDTNWILSWVLEDDEDKSIFLERCYKIKKLPLEGFNPISLVELAGIILLVMAFFILLILYNGSNIKMPKDGNLLWPFIYVLRNLLVASALTIFLFIVFSAFEVMGGLIAIDNTPTEISWPIAVLTIGAFTAVASFLLITWVVKWDFVDISTLSIVTLIVSYTLNILFTTHDWSHAYSQLGHSNTSTPAIFSGSQGLFLLTMVSLGLIFLAFALDTMLGLKDHLGSKNPFWLGLIFCLGVSAGVGSAIVGILPANEINWHNLGAQGTPFVSVAMMLTLTTLYPGANETDEEKQANNAKIERLERENPQKLKLYFWKVTRKIRLYFASVSEDRTFKNRKPFLRIMTGVILATLIIIFIIFAVLNGTVVDGLEVELVYFIMFLLYMQIYAKNLAEYIDEVEPEMLDAEATKLRNKGLVAKAMRLEAKAGAKRLVAKAKIEAKRLEDVAEIEAEKL